MNRRFRIRISYSGLVEDRELTLQVRVPYKLFGVIKYTYINVCSTYKYLISNDCTTQSLIEDYMVSLFERRRKWSLKNRVIDKMS